MMAMITRLTAFAWLFLIVGTADVVLAEENEAKYLLYIFTPDSETEFYRMQKRNLREEEAGIKKRDVAIVEIFYNGEVLMNGRFFEGLAAKSLYDDYAIMSSHFVVLLLDENKKVRLRLLRPVQAEELFTFIDTLPLRSPKPNIDKNRV